MSYSDYARVRLYPAPKDPMTGPYDDYEQDKQFESNIVKQNAAMVDIPNYFRVTPVVDILTVYDQQLKYKIQFSPFICYIQGYRLEFSKSILIDMADDLLVADTDKTYLLYLHLNTHQVQKPYWLPMTQVNGKDEIYPAVTGKLKYKGLQIDVVDMTASLPTISTYDLKLGILIYNNVSGWQFISCFNTSKYLANTVLCGSASTVSNPFAYNSQDAATFEDWLADSNNGLVFDEGGIS